MIPFKSLIVRLFEGKGRGEKKKKSVIVRITTREIMYIKAK